ncbi:hypothetical protein ACZ90_48565 [Streptomyces albus subsp. albus]|nr:hypothetical protein ACZ90_48565 [Streptomyces albus subsp. albus]NEB52806.1 hypothetical protein [Streptomyces griseus]SEE90413.1 hypothetical protein SAMN04490359_6931 [Streptomyces griseus]SQA21104.1 Uncharacterised protein [Streptomyces griseus]
MTEPVEPQHGVSARHQIEALLADLAQTAPAPPDPLARAQLSGLLTTLCLLQAADLPADAGRRLSLLRKARSHARTTTVLTAYLLNDSTFRR